MSSLATGEGGRSAGRSEKRLKSVTIVVTGLVERLRAKHVGFSLKISAIKAKIVFVIKKYYRVSYDSNRQDALLVTQPNGNTMFFFSK
jgi:hypothetical protein